MEFVCRAGDFDDALMFEFFCEVVEFAAHAVFFVSGCTGDVLCDAKCSCFEFFEEFAFFLREGHGKGDAWEGEDVGESAVVVVS